MADDVALFDMALVDYPDDPQLYYRDQN